jgi:mannitol-specific phosphotransferase system IIBC component
MNQYESLALTVAHHVAVINNVVANLPDDMEIVFTPHYAEMRMMGQAPKAQKDWLEVSIKQVL